MTVKSANKYILFIIVYEIFLSFLFSFLQYVPNLKLSLMGIQIFSQVVTFVLPFVIYLIISKRKVHELVLLNKISFFNVALILAMMLFVQPIMLFFSALSMLFFENNISRIMVILFNEPLPLLLLTLAVTPSICEELALRGVVLSGYKNVDVKKAALINGVLFGIIHLDPQQFLYAFALGSVFYLLVYYTKSIFASVIAHFVINATQVTMAYFAFHFSDNLDTAELSETLHALPEAFSRSEERRVEKECRSRWSPYH